MSGTSRPSYLAPVSGGQRTSVGQIQDPTGASAGGRSRGFPKCGEATNLAEACRLHGDTHKISRGCLAMHVANHFALESQTAIGAHGVPDL